MINIAQKYSAVTYKGNGSTKTFSIPFDYLEKSFVKVKVNGNLKNINQDYTIDDKEVTMATAPSTEETLELSRETPVDRLVDWKEGSILTASTMTTQEVQQLHIIEEAEYRLSVTSIVLNDEGTKWEGRYHPIGHVADPVDDEDVVTLGYVNKNESGLLNKLETACQTYLGNLKDKFDSYTNNLLSSFNTYTNNLKNDFDTYTANLKSQFDSFTSTLKSNFDSYTSSLTTQFNNAKTTLSDQTNTHLTFINDAYTADKIEMDTILSNTQAVSTTTQGYMNTTQGYMDNASTSAANAKTSEINAKASETHAEELEETMRNRVNNIQDGMPIGFEYITMNPNVPVGSLPLLGGTFSKETYKDLWEWVQQQTGYLISETEWQAKATAQNNTVPFYADTSDTEFRVPALTCWVKGATGVEEVGAYYSAGLPNIMGTTQLRPKDDGAGVVFDYTNGALTSKVVGNATDKSNSIAKGSTQHPYSVINFDASKSNAIYGHSTEVCPRTVVGMWCVKAFGKVTGVGSVEAVNMLKDVNNKVTEITPNPNKMWNTFHYYGNNYVPSDVTNVGWNKLGLCSIYYTSNLIANQPTQYGQLINIPAGDGNSIESTQLWMEQSSGKMFHRGGNGNGVMNNTSFTQIAEFTSDGHLKFPNGAELWIY